ncbi:MAG TPA: class GN sortase [Steroidobacteraceae bacterium]|nr:class GN sortase [Steroidobacteraceae bacterium]
MKRRLLVLAGGLLGLGLWQTGEAAYIHAKAWLAYGLIDRSWQRTLEGEPAVKPWPHADFWPVAKLRFPARDVELVVLSDATGRTLAFGPGQLSGTTTQGSLPAVIAGHRDTHFTALRGLEHGDRIELQSRSGEWTRYRVAYTFVITEDETPFLPIASSSVLTLITCHASTALGTTSGWLVLQAVREDAVLATGVSAETRSNSLIGRYSEAEGGA